MARRLSALPSVLFYLLLLLLTTVVPLVLSLEMLDPALIPRFMAWALGLSVLGVITAIHLLRDKTDTKGLFRHPLFLFGLLYLAATSTGFLVALNVNDWLFATLRTALAILQLVLSALILLWNRDRWMHLALASAGIGLGIALMGLLQWGGGLFVFSHSMDPPYGTMMHQNLFSSWLFQTLPLTLFGVLRARGGQRWFFVLSLVIIAVAIAASTTRAVWAASTLGLALAGMVYVTVNPKLSIETLGRTRIQKRVVAVLAFLILIAASFGFLFKVSDQFDDIEERTMLWKRTVELTVENPLLGLGAGNWVAHTNIENMRNQISKANWIRPHNDPLWVVSETGIGGLIGYAGLFLTALLLYIRVIRRSNDPDHKVLALMGVFAIFGYTLDSLSSFPRERIEHTAWIMTYLGLAFALHRVDQGSSGTRKPRNIGAGIGVGLGVLIALFSFVVSIYRFEGESHIRKAHVLMSGKAWLQALHEIDKAYTPFYSSHPNGLTLDYMRGLCNYELKRYHEAIKDFERSQESNPEQIMNTWYVGRAQVHLGQFREAVDSFNTCLTWWPNNKLTLPLIALAEYRLGMYEEAFIHLLRFRKIIHEDRKASTYEELWLAINHELGPDRAAELTEADTWQPRKHRYWKQTE